MPHTEWSQFDASSAMVPARWLLEALEVCGRSSDGTGRVSLQKGTKMIDLSKLNANSTRILAAMNAINTRFSFGLLAAVVGLAACKADSNGDADASTSCDMPGKATKGPADSHCGSDVTVVDMSVCHVVDTSDAGAGEAGASDFGETMYGMEGDDDDCKYHVKWSATSLCQDEDVYFTIDLTYKADGKPVKGAMPEPDITLNATVPADTAAAEAEETSAGHYRLGPVRFPQPGDWTVRFHFSDSCTDSETSPHGHAAFFVTIP